MQAFQKIIFLETSLSADGPVSQWDVLQLGLFPHLDSFYQLRSLIWKCYNSPMPHNLSGKMSYLQMQLLFWQLSFACVSAEVLICNPQGPLVVFYRFQWALIQVCGLWSTPDGLGGWEGIFTNDYNLKI